MLEPLDVSAGQLRLCYLIDSCCVQLLRWMGTYLIGVFS